jgi:chromosome segregation ATPase
VPKWNQFSEEVREERRTVRAYGPDKVQDRVREGDSYKAQALRQLAMRLELEEKIGGLQNEIANLIDRQEELELEVQNLRSERADLRNELSEANSKRGT